jgi:polygalacturonase
MLCPTDRMGQTANRQKTMNCFDVTSYGARPDGKTLNTAAIQAAVDACSAAGGGTVVVPPGEYLTGTVFLKSNLTLRLKEGAVLRGSPDISDYCADDAYAQNASCPQEGWCGAHLLAAVEQENITLTGEGVIDGNCYAFYDEPKERAWAGGLCWARGIRGTDPAKAPLRPGQMVVFVQCRRVRVRDLTLKNSTCWTVFFHGCRDVHVHGLTIDNPVDGLNTDGIDIDCCSQVTVSDCIIRTGDDAVTLRASGRRLKNHPAVCEDVAVTNCILDSSVCGFRIGVGSGVIRNVSISNIVLKYAGIGFLLQSSYRKPGQGVTIENITVNGVRGRQAGHPVKIVAGAEDTSGAKIRNIEFASFHTECCGGIEIMGSSDLLPDGISFRNCSFDVVCRDRPVHPEKRPETFLVLDRCGRISFIDCALNWNEPDPEWKSASKVFGVRELIMKDSVFPEIT